MLDGILFGRHSEPNLHVKYQNLWENIRCVWDHYVKAFRYRAYIWRVGREQHFLNPRASLFSTREDNERLGTSLFKKGGGGGGGRRGVAYNP